MKNMLGKILSIWVHLVAQMFQCKPATVYRFLAKGLSDVDTTDTRAPLQFLTGGTNDNNFSVPATSTVTRTISDPLASGQCTLRASCSGGTVLCTVSKGSDVEEFQISSDDVVQFTSASSLDGATIAVENAGAAAVLVTLTGNGSIDHATADAMDREGSAIVSLDGGASAPVREHASKRAQPFLVMK